MIAVFKQIVNDTLKNPKTGQWSRKNLTGFISFAYLIWYCTSGLMNELQVHEFVVITFASITVACLGISSWEKANIIKPQDKPAEISQDQLPS